jgi:hypothetical protein
MKTFKYADCIISSALIVAFVILRCWRNPHLLPAGYIAVGAWQMLSMIVHTVTGSFMRGNPVRTGYHLLAFIAVITIPLGSYWLLYFLAPFMATFYLGLCIIETRRMGIRPLAVLK